MFIEMSVKYSSTCNTSTRRVLSQVLRPLVSLILLKKHYFFFYFLVVRGRNNKFGLVSIYQLKTL